MRKKYQVTVVDIYSREEKVYTVLAINEEHARRIVSYKVDFYWHIENVKDILK